MDTIVQYKPWFIGGGVVVVSVLLLTFSFSQVSYSGQTGEQVTASVVQASTTVPVLPQYVETPQAVKAIYMTSWVAGTPSLRAKLVKLIDTTEINSVVIDVKDYSGRLSFAVQNPELKKFGSEEIRVADMRDFLAELHAKGIYTIARIAVFQDAFFIKAHPELAVKNLAGTAVWKDHKGISWVDAGSRPYWDYIVLIGQETRAAGFDELNFDYIRYPSDGNMKDVSYPQSGTESKHAVLKQFYAFLNSKFSGTGVKISADLFGLTTVADDDMGIGQVLTDALPYFDYIAPMVYPSHFAPGFDGFKNPADHPYEVIYKSMSSAVARAHQTLGLDGATTTPNKLRPWLQDFNLGATYGPTQVRDQIKAIYGVGLNSWMLWDASNKYLGGGLESK